MKNLLIIIVLLSCLINIGCFKEQIELDLNSSNKRLVVDAWISNLEEQQFIELSLTSDYFDSFEPTHVDDASITLSNSTETFDLEAVGNGKFNLPTNWTPIFDEEYKLDIKYNLETYTSSTILRTLPEIENLRYEKVENDSLDLYDIYFDFWENQGEGDGYYAIDYKKGTAQGDTLFNGGFTNDDFVDGIYFQDVTVTEEGHALGDTVIVELYSIGKEAADYLEAIGSEVYREGLFDPAPVNISSNISNGALGFFIIGGAQRTELILR